MCLVAFVVEYLDTQTGGATVNIFKLRLEASITHFVCLSVCLSVFKKIGLLGLAEQWARLLGHMGFTSLCYTRFTSVWLSWCHTWEDMGREGMKRIY